MREITLAELKAIQLEILDDVVRFCNDNRIQYSLAYGTLLGAIRHGGYIPWDDDIDIIMPRPDYDRFLETYISENNEVIDLSKNDACIELFSKVCRKGTIVEDIINKRRLWGINIDVFPVDGIPSNNTRAFYEAAVKRWDMLPRVCPFYKGVVSKRVIWFVKYLIKRIIYFREKSILSLKQELCSLQREQDFKSSALAGCYFGDAGFDEFMDKTIFDEYVEVIFEGTNYYAPAHYDKYLRNIYGNYLTPPPPEKRGTRHLDHSYVQD